ncbi:MAG: hypothetical protein FWH18_01860 [Marinilabiliaceae bacterium]|nr:hypothetical protein [Marinilabiliaceae bacterium]
MPNNKLSKVFTLKRLRNISIFWSLFIGIGALWGSTMMFIEPTGKIWDMYLLLPGIQKLPFSDILFQNFIFPGIALLLVNGVTNFISFILIYKKHRYAALSVMFCGIILMLWISIQFVIWSFNFMSNLYFIFGFLQAFTGYGYWKNYQ